MSTTIRWTAAAFLAACLLLAWSATAALAEPQGYIEDELGVGYFYGTFGEDPDIVLLVGGTAEEFCEDNPDDPFNAEPGIAPLRLFPRPDGSLDFKVNDKYQPIYLYYSEIGDGPTWIAAVCEDYFATGTSPEPFATGTADLKVRMSVGDDLVDVFNSVNGTATGVDGTDYKVRASADLVVVDGVPQGDPADFVDLQLTEIRR